MEGFYKQLKEIVNAWNEKNKTLKNIPSELENHLAAIEDQKTVPFANDLRTLINNFPEIPTIDETKLLEEIQYVRSRDTTFKPLTRPFLGFVLNPKSKVYPFNFSLKFFSVSESKS